MTHVRRKFGDIHRAQGSAIANETIRRIAQLYAVEKEVRESSPDHRVQIRQAKAKPIFDDLEGWLHTQLPSISGKSRLAGAICYALTCMTAGNFVALIRRLIMRRSRSIISNSIRRARNWT